MSVHPPGPPRPSPSGGEEPIQVPSKGPALSRTEKTIMKLLAPIAKVFFAETREKNKVLGSIVDQLKSVPLGPEKRVLQDSLWLLNGMNPEERLAVAPLFADLSFFESLVEVYKTHPKRLGLLLRAMSHKPPQLNAINGILGQRLRPGDQVKILFELSLLPKEAKDSFQRFMASIQNLQEKRPRFADDAEKKVLMEAGTDFYIGSLQSAGKGILVALIIELEETTFLVNSQIFQHYFEAVAVPATITPMRHVPLLSHRYDTPFSLQNEFHIPFSWNQNSYRLGDYSAEVMISDPRTMETATIKMPFPYEGECTEKEAKERLTRLSEMLTRRKDYEKGSEPERRFCDALEKRLTECLADFNATERFPRRGFSLEQAMRCSTILEMAKQGNLFLVEGRLSLLPPEVANDHPKLAFLQPDEFTVSPFKTETVSNIEFTTCDITYQGVTEHKYYLEKPSEELLIRDKLLLKARALK